MEARSAGFQSAVSQVSNLRRSENSPDACFDSETLPTGSRRYSRLEICATQIRSLSRGLVRIRGSWRSVALVYIITAALVLVAVGCGRKPESKAPLAELEKAFPAASADPVVSAALAAARTNGYAAGVMALQTAQQAPGMTPEQLMAVQQAMRAMTADLVSRAAAGDPQAKADLAEIEKTRSQ